ncbi:MAG: hypothetical protein ABF432_08945 [Acetobacter orientalis]
MLLSTHACAKGTVPWLIEHGSNPSLARSKHQKGLEQRQALIQPE